MCIWVWCNTLIIFSHFFCFVPCGRNSSYSFPPIVLKLCICFLHGMKMCMWFWYSPLIFVFSLIFSGTNLSFCSDSALTALVIAPLSKSGGYTGFVLSFHHSVVLSFRNLLDEHLRVTCGYNSSYSFPWNVLKLC